MAMTPAEMHNYLSSLVKNNIVLSTMIWGPPGVGKSSIVSQIAHEHGLEIVDLRLSQLAPTDLRGLPVAENNVSRWYPPEFFPTNGRGIFFLDEFNMSPPAMQGMAQQLILDRKVGSYKMPDGWFIWAAGNRREDRAAVFEMPAPVANRFIHLEVSADFDSLKRHAYARNWPEEIIGFLAFRPSLMHRPDSQSPAWPSPRSWDKACQLFRAGLDVGTVVGNGAAAEFTAYLAHRNQLPNLQGILDGKGKEIPFPHEPSVRYATVVGLTSRANTIEHALNAFRWLNERAGAEWIQTFGADLIGKFRGAGKLGELAIIMQKEPQLAEMLKKYKMLALS